MILKLANWLLSYRDFATRASIESLFYSASLVNKHRNRVSFGYHSKTAEPRMLNFGRNMVKKKYYACQLGKS